MAGSVLEPKDILEYSAHKGTMKAENRADRLAVLGFLGGAFISVGYLAYVRIVAAMPHELAGLGKLLGAAVFPVGLVCILLGGGELITGNMMALPVAWLKRHITLRQWARNWAIVTATNILGAFFGGVLKCMLINGGQTKSNGGTVYLRCGSSKYHLLSPLPWAEYKAKRQIRQ